MATHLAPLPPDQMPRKDFGLHFFTFLPPNGESNNNSAPSKAVWDRFFLHPNISYCQKNKGGSFLNESIGVGLTADRYGVIVAPGYPNFTNPYPNAIQTHETNVALTAKRFADYFEYMGFKRGKGIVLSDGEYAGAIHLHLFGSFNAIESRAENPGTLKSQRSLFFNHNRIDSNGNPIQNDPEFGDNDRLPYTFGHHTKATLRNRPHSSTHGHTLGDFVKLTMQALRQECDNRGLCYPLYMINDNEDVIKVGGGIRNINYTTQPAPVGARNYRRNAGSLIGGWFNRSSPPAILPPENVFSGILMMAGEMGQRFDQPIYYDWDGSNWVEKTYLQAFEEYGIQVVGPDQNQFPESQWIKFDSSITGAYIDGQPYYYNSWFRGIGTVTNVQNFFNGITGDGTLSYRDIRVDNINNIFAKKMSSILSRIEDHGMYKAIFEPAKEVFPNMKCGNIGLIAAIDNKNPYYDPKNNFIKEPVTEYPSGKRLLRSDFSCPEIPGVEIDTSAITRFGVSAYRELRNLTIGYHAFGNTPQQIYRNYMVHQVKACFSNQNPLPVIPLIWLPWQNTNGSPGYIVRPEDYLYVLQEHYKLGVRQWSIYNQYSLQVYTNTAANPPVTKLLIEWFMDVVDEFVAWTQTQNPPPPPPPPTANELQPVNPSGVRMSRLRLK